MHYELDWIFNNINLGVFIFTLELNASIWWNWSSITLIQELSYSLLNKMLGYDKLCEKQRAKNVFKSS